MDPTERRRDIRARISLPATIVRRGSFESVEMIDASYRGLFLRIEEPPPERELVKLLVKLPTREITLHAVVVRIVDDMMGYQGVGVRFFALNGQDRADWESFMNAALRELRARAA
jgi:hypothetical protein